MLGKKTTAHSEFTQLPANEIAVMDRPSDEVVDIESGHYTDKDVLHEDEREPLHDPESFDLDSLELQDLEKSEKHATSIQKPIDRLHSGVNYRLILLIAVNTFATVGIVSN